MKLLSGDEIPVIGLMSGTSLDGLDLAACRFRNVKGKWEFELLQGKTVKYSNQWRQLLQNAANLSGEELIELHNNFAYFMAQEIRIFIDETGFTPELVASHGHTVFHQPEKRFTFQVGNGAIIAGETGITTVCDFRTADIALGGQGAPLVPIGDRLLFGNFEYCLNLGGFANISYEEKGKRIAFDICPANIVLNYFAEKQGLTYDVNGCLGDSGTIINDLLNQLNNIDFYRFNPPKSLGREWVESVFLPLADSADFDDQDKLRTVYEHIGQQIGKATRKGGAMLVTGGGAFNPLLMKCITEHSNSQIVIPEEKTVIFKEALLFAFLGVLRITGQNNCLASVTGAKTDHCSGIVYPATPCLFY
ncbi:MAG: anhydro-N-acetylmuramic acid kinase [Draconibacterium sp.]|nr:MAG: anhydro-N-acetylmuramic acid kinase [Draconibacterium sp.]